MNIRDLCLLAIEQKENQYILNEEKRSLVLIFNSTVSCETSGTKYQSYHKTRLSVFEASTAQWLVNVYSYFKGKANYIQEVRNI